jgi:hypothetical protein
MGGPVDARTASEGGYSADHRGLPDGLSRANLSARGPLLRLIKKASLVVLSVLSLGGLGGDLSGGRLIDFGPAVVAKLVFQPGNSR